MMAIPMRNFSMTILIISLIIGVFFEFTECAAVDKSRKKREFLQSGPEAEPINKEWTINVDPPGQPAGILGSSITLNCTATDPNVEIWWMHWMLTDTPNAYTPKRLSITDGIVRITNMTKNDFGVYVCVGKKKGLMIATYIHNGVEGRRHTETYSG